LESYKLDTSVTWTSVGDEAGTASVTQVGKFGMSLDNTVVSANAVKSASDQEISEATE